VFGSSSGGEKGRPWEKGEGPSAGWKSRSKNEGSPLDVKAGGTVGWGLRKTQKIAWQNRKAEVPKVTRNSKEGEKEGKVPSSDIE